MIDGANGAFWRAVAVVNNSGPALPFCRPLGLARGTRYSGSGGGSATPNGGCQDGARMLDEGQLKAKAGMGREARYLLRARKLGDQARGKLG